MPTGQLGAAGPADTDLLRAYRAKRDEAAFAAVVGRHAPMVWGVCRRVLGHDADAEDAFQAVFLVLARRADHAAGRRNLAGWLYGVTVRVARKARDRRARRREAAGEVPDVAAEAPAASDAMPVIDEELARLPAAFRDAVLLCDVRGLTRAEAAAAMGCAEGTASSRLSRGRSLLARRLAARGVTPTSALLTALCPRGLPEAAARTACRWATGHAAGLKPQVAALSTGVIFAMSMNRIWAVLLAGLFAAGAGGLLVAGRAGEQPPKSEPPAGDKKPPQSKPPAAKRAGEPASFTAQDVCTAFGRNEARADEYFLGKRIRVKIWLEGVRLVKSGKGKGEDYYLAHCLMAQPKPIEPLPGGLGGAGGGGRWGGVNPLWFKFPTRQRKALADLQVDQWVTLEGECVGVEEPSLGINIPGPMFKDCRVVERHGGD